VTRDLDELRKVAERATPGPWTEFHENGTPGEFEPFNCPPATGATLLDYAPMEQRAKDAKFIATFDPTTVLALLTQLEQAEQAVARVREKHSPVPARYYGTDLNPHREFDCNGCGEGWPWPCSNIRAVDGDQA